MLKNWWKVTGVLLVLFALTGGLFTPLKTGITGVRLADTDSLNIISGKTSRVLIDIYNPGAEFAFSTIILKRDSSVQVGLNPVWNSDGSIACDFHPMLGMNGSAKEGLYTMYVLANKQWMAFPAALSIQKGISDTGISAQTMPLAMPEETDSDLIPGFPNRPILNESIRNLLFHVPMWFSMIFILAFAAWYSVRYLRNGKLDDDLRSSALVQIGILAGLLGTMTGSVWASVTWDNWWPRDPKLNGVAIGMLMYLAYLLLRKGIPDEHQRARVSAVYNLFVFPIFIALIIIMPKLSGDSLHPGAGGTVTFKQYDLDNTLRMFFYPAVAGWIMIFSWVASLLYRYKILKLKIDNEN